MRHPIVPLFAACVALAAASPAFADAAAPAAVDPQPRHRWVGVQLDLGVPDGMALGVVVRPSVDWLRLELAATNNVLAFGGRVGVTVDPINFGFAPTLTVEGGFSGQGTVPGHKADVPTVGYDYANFHFGLEFGNRNTWRFFIHAGPSFVHLATGNFQNTVGSRVDGLVVGNPTADAWLLPTGKLGFALYF